MQQERQLKLRHTSAAHHALAMLRAHAQLGLPSASLPLTLIGERGEEKRPQEQQKQSFNGILGGRQHLFLNTPTGPTWKWRRLHMFHNALSLGGGRPACVPPCLQLWGDVTTRVCVCVTCSSCSQLSRRVYGNLFLMGHF